MTSPPSGATLFPMFPEADKERALHIGITEQNLSLLRTGNVKGAHFSTPEEIFRILECQPFDVLGNIPDK